MAPSDPRSEAEPLALVPVVVTWSLQAQHGLDTDGTVPESLWERDCGLVTHFWFTLLPANGSHGSAKTGHKRRPARLLIVAPVLKTEVAGNVTCGFESHPRR
jgi:hypothetical protein